MLVSGTASVAMTVVAVAVFLITGASSVWQYLFYPLLAAVPVACALASAHMLRLSHVELLRRYQGQLIFRTVELEKMASHDELTQLFNRRYFYDRLKEVLGRARLTRQTLALILLDIDQLKHINDEYGHAVGDIMIANLAKVVEKHTRASDVAARLGGDEFAILMPDTDKRGAFSMAERLWDELEEAPMYEHEGIRLMMSVSIGVSGFPWGGEDIDEMMHWADSDMYANKLSRKLPRPAVAASEQQVGNDLEPGEFERI